MAPYWRPFPPRFMIGLVIGGLFLLFVAGPAFHFIPLLFLLIWAVPFLVAPAVVGRGVGALESRAEGWDGDRGERKERSFWRRSRGMGSSPALAALETSPSVAEANRMLSDLANSGHVK